MSFEDADFAHVCGNEKELRKRHGLVRARKIMQRLKSLGAAETLADMRSLPGRCHELHGNRAGQLSLDLDHPYRLLLRPAGAVDPGSSGGLDWAAVNAVRIIGIVDTHD